jgi:hypothetical protein
MITITSTISATQFPPTFNHSVSTKNMLKPIMQGMSSRNAELAKGITIPTALISNNPANINSQVDLLIGKKELNSKRSTSTKILKPILRPNIMTIYRPNNVFEEAKTKATTLSPLRRSQGFNVLKQDIVGSRVTLESVTERKPRFKSLHKLRVAKYKQAPLAEQELFRISIRNNSEEGETRFTDIPSKVLAYRARRLSKNTHQKLPEALSSPTAIPGYFNKSIGTDDDEIKISIQLPAAKV